MAYLSRNDLTPGRIKPDFFTSALDDDRDGVEDAGLADLIINNASAEVDVYLTRYSPPMTNAPALVKMAGLTFAGFEIYRRAGFAEAPGNPFAEDRAYYRGRLEKIAAGDERLGLEHEPDGGPVAAITDVAKTHSAGGNLLY